MNKNNQKLTAKGQTSIDLACTVGAILIWLILLSLGGLTEVFFYILIAYHIIGGLLNRDLAKNLVSAILLAPLHVGGKIALYVQHIIVEDNFNNLTTDDLVNINHSVTEIINKHPNQEKIPMRPILYGCATYGELKLFNEQVVRAYNKRKNNTV